MDTRRPATEITNGLTTKSDKTLPVNTAAGLEAGLIAMIRPSWNIKGAQ